MADRAMQYYQQITPFLRKDLDCMKVEPYVYCGNVAGPEHKQFGYSRNAWLSGTASWTYVASTQWILGIRPTHEGLMIAPVIPDKWRGFKATRVFRGVRYIIDVKRQGKGNQVALVVDGQPVEGAVVPLPSAGAQEVKVEVKLGQA
jgi:cellobiose phosphorylase